MKEYAQSFYRGKQWRKVSRLYMESRNYVCERCGGVGAICHHRKYINPWNINDPSITLSLDNLECLCQECHNREHSAKVERSRAVFDANGNMIGAKETKEIEEYKRAVQAIERLKNDRVESPQTGV